MKAQERAPTVRVRDLVAGDLDAVVRIDALHTGEAKPDYWRRVFAGIRGLQKDAPPRVGLAAEEGGALVGYLVGEVRAFEFGSDPCGWVHAVGVDPGRLRARVGSELLA
ncbi:MAG TPA: GNAT family N-acetyltransferase, partial [Candidatus Polarisedimenticolia bacterium]|nr:GNAT family N-acetyltransferase [Candidatus Polarisedimenticolia bacterium]